ncbi:MAG: M23 family metallopeptidase [Actinomycetes bacterium]
MRIRPIAIALLVALLGVLAEPLTVAADGIELAFPVEHDQARFSNTWGARRSGGRRHQGSDIMAPKRTEVYAAASGVVTRVTASGRAGRYVAIDHGGGWETYYMHLNNDIPGSDRGDAPWFLTVAWGIHEGAEVRAGQLIGWVGDSGNAEGSSPHLHFELHRNGKAINPYPYLVDALGRARLANRIAMEAARALDVGMLVAPLPTE